MKQKRTFIDRRGQLSDSQKARDENMSDVPSKIPDTDEAWEEGQLGQDKEYARPLDEKSSAKAIDESLGLQMISIRLHKNLIDEFKSIAAIHGIGYQTLMRQSLTRFARGEMKRLAKDMAEGLQGKELCHSAPVKRRRAA
jgi:predicted DNA binding CopG/RHH family protein